MRKERLSRLRALVVDDDPFMQELVKLTLERLGLADVQTAGDGREALDKINQGNPFDLVLCDLHMPGMDGIELLRHLSDFEFGGGLILFSGTDERILRAAVSLARARFLNVLGSIHKPVTLNALASLIFRFEEAAGCGKKTGQRVSVLTKHELKQSLAEDHLTLFYQPQVDMYSGAVVGVEALARLRHSTHGVLRPAAFVPLTEDDDLIVPFTEAILKQALNQALRWSEDGQKLRVAINLSAAALTQLDLPQIFADCCSGNGLPPELVMLEITESQITSDAIESLEVLTRMRLHGIQLSIDDFGTGYSSLERLKQIPFDELKIDGSFVHGAVSDITAKAIFTSSVALGKQLALSVLAEGVETPEDWSLALDLGCDLVQGYYVAHPMAPDDLNRWMRDWKGLANLPSH
ncbi:hypothetical protein CAI21_16625 [Alkalilimnicola ehrlichii]|uniref:Diguanylate phosphodiesterase n=1 Tax=Alkalilimnicola ehrlichii TaxID=351052 RepID=A0A3E0WIU8_9GAMM|nr:EAL domain-containing response regulator [Alkalilimnicola ehrlichii]RFA26588.1 hypothetical protein CAI21_16625 [Alkalilimnicola ehrlichii]RFA32910.1 hypothetical protein CAL65_18365 [Alkalilimnicola ehrlichii]